MEETEGREGGAAVVVTGLNIYPVKSCRGIALPIANLASTGFEWDRQWQIVNPKGRFITQRQEPRLALIEVSLPNEALDRNWGPLLPDSALCLKAPGMQPLQVPLNASWRKEKVPASVWEWYGHAFDEGSSAADWLSEYLGRPGTRLVRFDTGNETRSTDPQYADGYKTAFSDGYPILLASKINNGNCLAAEFLLDLSCSPGLIQASLDAVNERLREPLPMNRFRPNIVVEGCKAFAEDLWAKFKIGDVSGDFKGVKLCSRCKITTTNQQTAEVGKEPLAIMKGFRLGQLLSNARQMKGQVYFGQNVIFNISDGLSSIVKVGDKVHILQEADSVSEVMAKAGA